MQQKSNNCRFSMIVISMMLASSTVYAAEPVDPYQDNLLGDWGGTRTTLANAGIDATVEYKADIVSIVTGGTKRGSDYLDNLDIKFAMDGDKLAGLPGSRAFIYFINNNGGKPNLDRMGSLQGIDNIEVGTNSFKLYEAWVEQDFLGDKLSLLAGLHDLNSEFAETDLTANFIKPSFQIEPTLAQSGANGPSIFPNTALAARVKYKVADDSYMQAGAFNGIAGNPGNPHSSNVRFNNNDGLLIISEVGYTPPSVADGMNKFAVGAWSYTKEFDDMVETDNFSQPVKRASHGGYALAAYELYGDKDSGRSVGAFARLGVADGNTKPVDIAYSTGLVARGFVPARPQAEIGIGFTDSHNADKYRQAGALAGDVLAHDEYGAELYYRDQLTRGVRFEPDVQYIANPSGSASAKDALIVGARLDLNF